MTKELTREQIEAEINALSHEAICRLWRHAPSGHRYFDMSLPYWPIFEKRFKELGGFTPELSKKIGW